MTEGAPVMYAANVGGGGIENTGAFERPLRHYSLELLHLMGSQARAAAQAPASPQLPGPRRLPHIRRDRRTLPSGDESDDSSASSSTHLLEKGSKEAVESGSRLSENGGCGAVVGGGLDREREWRRYGNRGHTPQRRHHLRFTPDRLPLPPFPYQVKYPPDTLLNGSKWDPLSQEIWEKFMVAQQTEVTFKKKMHLWEFLHYTIKSICPNYSLYLVGSTKSGFGLDSSDMDLCLHVKPQEPLDSRSNALLHLRYIQNLMQTFNSIISGADIINAKVPILKFRDTRHGIDVDLNCNNIVGIRNTNLLQCYSQLDWRVRPLVLAIKLWAQSNSINDARHSTLSSYSITLMVIHYLQCGTSPPVLPCVRVHYWPAWENLQYTRPPPPPHTSQNQLTLGELFLGFLNYYANFQYDQMAVSVRTGRCVPVYECRAVRTHKNDPHQWKLLCVEEPFDLTNTARSVYDPETFEKIVKVFKNCHEMLAQSLRLQDIMPCRQNR